MLSQMMAYALCQQNDQGCGMLCVQAPMRMCQLEIWDALPERLDGCTASGSASHPTLAVSSLARGESACTSCFVMDRYVMLDVQPPYVAVALPTHARCLTWQQICLWMTSGFCSSALPEFASNLTSIPRSNAKFEAGTLSYLVHEQGNTNPIREHATTQTFCG